MTTDAAVLAVLSSPVLRTFGEYYQHRPHDAEAGGVLLGCRRGKHFEVVHATQPFPSDSRTRTSFSRDALGHQQEAVAHWHRSEARVGYVGEWHTHPEGVPSPSWLDKREWRKLVKDRRPAAPLLVVIVGTSTLYVALVDEFGHICPMVAAVR
jgi:integrative and conjugative element protein (TIGR02256 family)